MRENKQAIDPKTFLTAEERKQVAGCVRLAETKTSCEIRIRIEQRCPKDSLEHCRELLQSLGILQTKDRNGVLLYISLEDHQLAVYGDEAVDHLIGSEGWNSALELLREHFRAAKYAEGLCKAVEVLSRTLESAFPAKPGDINELPNEPSVEE
jgi:uncharacterized membrane protein